MYHTQLPGLYLEFAANRGRSVHSSVGIPENSLIEICPVILLDSTDTAIIHKTRLHDYYFIWDVDQKTAAIALGFGSLYNHSENANAEFLLDKENKEIRIVALQEIATGDEITINYIASKAEGYKLWFEPK